MNKQKIVPLAVLTLVVLGGATLGISKLSPTAVQAQSPTVQVQQVASTETPDVNEKPDGSAEAAEPANEQVLPGGGHQDPSETNVDHQFEGVE